MTIHRQVWAEFGEEAVETAAGRARLAEARKLARAWDSTKIVGSGYGSNQSGQLLALAEVADLIYQGHIAILRVEVGEEPAADRARALNARLLSDLCPPFTATVNPGHQGDGYLTWSEPVVADTLGEDPQKVSLRPYHAPLEIGDSLASRTWLHLIEDGAVARWPYGEREVFLFVYDEEERTRQVEERCAGLLDEPDAMAEMLRALREGYSAEGMRVDY